MKTPRLSIIIPTYNRPHLLPLAVNSALDQTLEYIEVIVVDDASPQPVHLPEHPRLRIIRLDENKGGSAARNIGAKAAKGRWVTYLDDDDRLLAHMAQVSLKALENTTLPQPVAALSGLEVINEQGQVIQTRIPPSLPKGSHFCLEEIAPTKSFFCKQTMVVEKEVLLSIGGFDESFTSRVHTELFLRLNQICSLQGIPTITYQLLDHQNARVSADLSRRQVNFHRLVNKHKSLFEAHPKMFANFIYDHAMMSHNSGQTLAAIKSIGKAMRIHPIHTIARMGSPFKRGIISLIYQSEKQLINRTENY